jgi:hypothetical protein
MSVLSQGIDLPRYGRNHSRNQNLRFNSYPQRPHSEPLCTVPSIYSQRLLPTPMTTPNSSTASLLISPQSHMQHEAPRGIITEHTPSGNSIVSAPPSIAGTSSQSQNRILLGDLEAADLVEDNIRHIHSKNKHVRYLLSILSPSSLHHSHPSLTDDKTLRSLLHLFNTLFFSSTLTERVWWEWSDAPKYHSSLLATTALRHCSSRPGFETLIVMSSPLLRSDRYETRLLLGTFIHELIHCYLFVNCGFKAREGGGHTKGFNKIARGIRKWVAEFMGKEGDYLGLGCEKADLEAFRRKEEVSMDRYAPLLRPLDDRMEAVGNRRREESLSLYRESQQLTLHQPRLHHHHDRGREDFLPPPHYFVPQPDASAPADFYLTGASDYAELPR